MKKVTIPFGPWVPDAGKITGNHVVKASGVLPASTGYRPFKGGLTYGASVPAAVCGACLFFGSDGSLHTIVGTRDKLYVRDDLNTWTEKGGGYTAQDHTWSMCQYGDYIFCANGVDKVQYAQITGPSVSSFQDLPGAYAPKGSRVAVVGNFLMVGDLENERNKIQWSVIDDPLNWPQPGSNTAIYGQSDFQVFPEGGNVQAIVSGMSGYEGLVFLERAIYRMQYSNSSVIFQITAVDKSIGTIAPNSVIHHNNIVYWLSERGLFATDGSTVTNISDEVLSLWLDDAIETGRENEVIAAIDPLNNTIVFAFAGPNAQARMSDTLLIYNPALKAFSTVNYDLEYLYTDCSRGVTLEDLDSLGPLDSLDVSLDSRSFYAQALTLSGFNGSHTPIIFSGENVPVEIETAEQGEEQLMIHGIRPIVDGASPEAYIKYRSALGDTQKVKKCAPASRLDKICRTRTFGRYAAVNIKIPEKVNWTHATGAEMFFEKGGWH